MGTLALVGLGSNVGDRKAHLDRAIAALAETSGVTVQAVSKYHETAPIGGPIGQGAFLNAAARLDTILDPFAMLSALHDLEAEAGRVRSIRWGERTLDLDLLLYSGRRVYSDELILPHPWMAVRRFVLAPLAEIAPTVVGMGSRRTVAQLLTNLDRRPSYVAIDAPPGPRRDELFSRILTGLPSVGLSESEVVSGIGHCGLGGPDVVLSPYWSPEAQAKVRRLNASHWSVELGVQRWLVTDFCESMSILAYEHRRSRPREASRTDPESAGAIPVEEWLLPPTFVVAIEGGAFDTLVPRGSTPFGPNALLDARDVLIFPRSTTPEGIAQEVLSACAASRS